MLVNDAYVKIYITGIRPSLTPVQVRTFSKIHTKNNNGFAVLRINYAELYSHITAKLFLTPIGSTISLTEISEN